MTAPPKSVKKKIYDSLAQRYDASVQKKLTSLEEELKLTRRRFSSAPGDLDRRLLNSSARAMVTIAQELAEMTARQDTLEELACFLEEDGPEPDFTVRPDQDREHIGTVRVLPRELEPGDIIWQAGAWAVVLAAERIRRTHKTLYRVTLVHESSGNPWALPVHLTPGSKVSKKVFA
jgi:hypothetical protein